jgi:hypothetical protein
LKNLSNPYVINGDRSVIRRNWERLSEPAFLGKKAIREGNTFVFRTGVQGMFGAGITFKKETGGLSATFFSTHLKGDGDRSCGTGEWKQAKPSSLAIWSFVMASPTLVFKNNETGITRQFKIYSGTIGNVRSGILTPWLKKDMNLESGNYNVSYKGSLKFKCQSQSQNININLTKQMTIVNLIN